MCNQGSPRVPTPPARSLLFDSRRSCVRRRLLRHDRCVPQRFSVTRWSSCRAVSWSKVGANSSLVAALIWVFCLPSPVDARAVFRPVSQAAPCTSAFRPSTSRVRASAGESLAILAQMAAVSRYLQVILSFNGGGCLGTCGKVSGGSCSDGWHSPW